MQTEKEFVTILGSMELFQKIIPVLEQSNRLNQDRYSYSIITENGKCSMNVFADGAMAFYLLGMITQPLVAKYMLGDVTNLSIPAPGDVATR